MCLAINATKPLLNRRPPLSPLFTHQLMGPLVEAVAARFRVLTQRVSTAHKEKAKSSVSNVICAHA